MEPVDEPVPASSAPLGDVDPRADALYAGDAGVLRPVHDAVVMLAEGLGDDAHRETGVPARGTVEPWERVTRRTGFAVVGPGPGDRVRVGLRFTGEPPADERLSPATGFGGATHWLDLPADCDEDDIRSLEPLLEAAYLQNG